MEEGVDKLLITKTFNLPGREAGEAGEWIINLTRIRRCKCAERLPR